MNTFSTRHVFTCMVQMDDERDKFRHFYKQARTYIFPLDETSSRQLQSQQTKYLSILPTSSTDLLTTFVQ